MRRRRFRFPGRHCLVTGAASGIGRATAAEMAARGAILHLTDINAAGLGAAAAAIESGGGRVATSEPLDLRDHEAVLGLAAGIHAGHGSLDLVANVAGYSIWGPIESMPHEDWLELIETDLIAPVSVLEAFVPAMIAAGRGGHIVNVSSGAGLLGLPWHAAYSAAKFGLRGVSEVLRFDLERHRIGVSLVCPGGVRTPLMESIRIVGTGDGEAGTRELIDHFEKRTVSPEQAARRIVRGVERGRHLIYTSFDVRLGFWAQRWCPPAYAWAMRRLNDRLVRAAGIGSGPPGQALRE